MLDTFGDLFEAAAKLPKEAWSSIGLGLGMMVLAFLGVVSSRKGAADKAAQPGTMPTPVASPAGGLTFLADSDTELAILEELRGLRQDQAKRYDEAERRRTAAIAEENHDLRERMAQMESRLRAGQIVTHDTQSALGSKIDELMGTLQSIKGR